MNLFTVVTGLSPGLQYDFQLQARNLIGYSPVSLSTTVLAAQVPDEPEGLANVVDVTTATQIGLQWTLASFNGGSAVIDYRIWYDNAGSEFEVLVDGVIDSAYTVLGMTTGSTYTFKVQARNAYGYSWTSNTESILAAQKPAIPSAPTTSFADGFVTITWSAPSNMGSIINVYSVTILQSDGVYQSSATYCDGSS